jgi:hypothetical protein
MKKIVVSCFLLLGVVAGSGQVFADGKAFDIEKIHLQKVYAGRTEELREYAKYLFLKGVDENDWGKITEALKYYEVLVDSLEQVKFVDEYLEVLIVCRRDDGLPEFYKTILSFENRHGAHFNNNSRQIMESLKANLSDLLLDRESHSCFLEDDGRLRKQVNLKNLELAVFQAVNAREYQSKSYLILTLQRTLSRVSIEDDPDLYYYAKFNLALLEDDEAEMKEMCEKLASINSKFMHLAKVILLGEGGDPIK